MRLQDFAFVIGSVHTYADWCPFQIQGRGLFLCCLSLQVDIGNRKSENLYFRRKKKTTYMYVLAFYRFSRILILKFYSPLSPPQRNLMLSSCSQNCSSNFEAMALCYSLSIFSSLQFFDVCHLFIFCVRKFKCTNHRDVNTSAAQIDYSRYFKSLCYATSRISG